MLSKRYIENSITWLLPFFEGIFRSLVHLQFRAFINQKPSRGESKRPYQRPTSTEFEACMSGMIAIVRLTEDLVNFHIDTPLLGITPQMGYVNPPRFCVGVLVCVGSASFWKNSAYTKILGQVTIIIKLFSIYLAFFRIK